MLNQSYPFATTPTSRERSTTAITLIVASGDAGGTKL